MPTTRPRSTATIVSRCVTIPFDPVPDRDIADWLVGRGVDPAQAAAVAGASGGRLDRAELLVADPGFAARQGQWRVPPLKERERGGGCGCVRGTAGPRWTRHWPPYTNGTAHELATLAEQSEAVGAKGITGRRGIKDRHKREERRLRTDDLRFGLATLAGVSRDRLVTSAGPTVGGDVSPGPRSGPSTGRPTGGCHRAGHRGSVPQSQRVTPFGHVDGDAVGNGRRKALGLGPDLGVSVGIGTRGGPAHWALGGSRWSIPNSGKSHFHRLQTVNITHPYRVQAVK